MRTPIDWWRRRSLQRRYFPGPRSGSGTTAKVGLALVVVILGLAAVLEVRDRGGASLAERLESTGVEPVDLVASAGRTNRVVLLGDVSGSALPKRLAADAIERLAKEQGLDAVGLEVDGDEQRWIDEYLESEPEDASVLLTHPRVLRSADGSDRAYLELYRRMWQLNRELGPARRVRVIAMDLPGWPPARAVSPAAAAAQYARRDSVMWARMEERILSREPRARLFLFVDGLHVLQAEASVQTGGTSTFRFSLLAERFRREEGDGAVWSAVVDAPPARGVTADVAKYRISRLFAPLRNNLRLPSGRLGAPLTEAFRLAPSQIETISPPGIELVIEPGLAGRLADAYIYLGG